MSATCWASSSSRVTSWWVVMAPTTIGVALVAHPAELGDAAEVDDQRRVTHAQPQDGDEALAAGHELGVVPAVDQRLDRLVDRGRPDVVERCRDHRCPPWVSPFEMSPAVEPRPAPGEATSASSPRPAVPLRGVDRRPHPVRGGRHVDVGDAVLAHGVEHGVHDGGRGGDGARLADTLDAQRVGRRRGRGVRGVEVDQVRRRGQRVVDQRAREQRPWTRRRRPPRRAPARCPARGRRGPGPRRSAG